MADGAELKKVFEICGPDEDGCILTDFLAAKIAEQLDHQDLDTLKSVLDPKRLGKISFEQFRCAVLEIQEYSDRLAKLPTVDICPGSIGLSDKSNSDLEHREHVTHICPDATLQPKTNLYIKDDDFSSSDPENTYNEYDVPDVEDLAQSVSGDDITESFEAAGESPVSSRHKHADELGLPSPAIPGINFKRHGSFRKSHKRAHSYTAHGMSLTTTADDEIVEDEASSLNSDFEDLSEKVDMLQDHVAKLTEEKKLQAQYEAVNSEKQQLALRNHELEERLSNLEEKIDELKMDHSSKLEDMQNKLKREQNLVLEILKGKLENAEKDNIRLNGELSEMRDLMNKVKEEKLILKTKVESLTSQVMQTNEEYRRLNSQSIAQREREEEDKMLLQDAATKLKIELEEAIADRNELMDRLHRVDASQAPSAAMLSAKLSNLEIENERLKSANEDLNVQLARNIVDARTLIGASLASDSIASELVSATRDEVVEALQKKEQENLQLRKYLDKIILSVLEKDPSILEIK